MNNIHTYIHVLLKDNKNNFLVNNYNRVRFYRILIDTGPFYSTYKKLLQGGII